MPKQVIITPEVREVLTQAVVEGPAERPVLKLNQPGLERGLYVSVDKALKALGGKWDRRAGGHVFDRPLDGPLADALASGVAVDKARTAEQFFTPANIAERIVEMATLTSGLRVLEPSAGAGALIEAVAATTPSAVIDAVEKDERLAEQLRVKWGRRATVICADFLALEWETPRYDRVVMNPPFSRGQDIAHVTRAFSLLLPGGRLVAVMSPHWVFANDRAANDFRVALSRMGDDMYDWEYLPDGSFKMSGTAVSTGLLSMRKGD